MIFKNIDFDIYYGIDEDMIKNLFDEFLNYVNEKDISHIEICDRDQGYIFIEKEGKEDEWDKDEKIYIIELPRRSVPQTCRTQTHFSSLCSQPETSSVPKTGQQDNLYWHGSLDRGWEHMRLGR